MSRQNLESVRRTIDALNPCGGVFDEAEPAVVQGWSRAVGPDRGIYRGYAEVTRFLRSWWEVFDVTFMDVGH